MECLEPSHSQTVERNEAEEKDASSGLLPPISCAADQKPNREDPLRDTLHEQHRTLEDNTCLLVELARIEQELRESLRREEERQQELERIRQEENRQRWRSLCFLSLNQRTAKPWVTSYYKNIPMHIYCLPIEAVAQRQKKKKR
ncbi:hypothetical protein AOLI_G00308850 [Acnodon oligacanthus]